jgi:NADH-quinone oxidoreductase subunit J
MVREEIVFWALGPVMVLASLALLFARKAVHVAVGVVVVMIGLAVFYVAQDAAFLGVVQIVVYTGAVMMLFLFVLMLVGVDQRESLAETIRGQRIVSLLAAAGLAALLISVLGTVVIDRDQVGGLATANADGNPQAIAAVMFGAFVLVIEALGVLLTIAAVGAIVLTHMPRLRPTLNQRARSDARIQGGRDPVNKPMPGVYARHNALDTPALDPLGNPIEASISRVLRARKQTLDVPGLPQAVEIEPLAFDGNETEGGTP